MVTIQGLGAFAEVFINCLASCASVRTKSVSEGIQNSWHFSGALGTICGGAEEAKKKDNARH